MVAASLVGHTGRAVGLEVSLSALPTLPQPSALDGVDPVC